MSVSIKPLEDRVVIQTVEAEQTTSFGLEIGRASCRERVLRLV